MKTLFLVSSLFILISNPAYSQISFGAYDEVTFDLYKFGKQNSGDVSNFFGFKSIMPVRKNWDINLSMSYSEQWFLPIGYPITNLPYSHLTAYQIKISPTIQYKFIEYKDFSIYGLTGPGITYNITQESNAFLPYYREANYRYLYNLSSILGIGANYRLKNWIFLIEPTYAYNFWSNQRWGVENPFHSTIGIGLGVLYSSCCK